MEMIVMSLCQRPLVESISCDTEEEATWRQQKYFLLGLFLGGCFPPNCAPGKIDQGVCG